VQSRLHVTFVAFHEYEPRQTQLPLMELVWSVWLMLEQLGKQVLSIELKMYGLGQLQARLIWFQTKLGLQVHEPGRELTLRV
jgi:hypothetical protein